MKCKAVHIGREKRNTFGTVLRSNSGSISSAGRPVHCCEELYEDLHSCTCPQKKTALGCTWNKYTVSNPGCKETFTGGAPRLLLAESQCVYCKTSSKEHERTARPTGAEKRCRVRSDQPYVLCRGMDVIEVSTSMKTLRRFLFLTL